MGWFVLATLALLCVGGGIFAAVIGYRLPGIATAVGAGLIFLGITAMMSYDQVENGHIGIVKQFGSLVGTTGDGLVSHAPWQSVSEVSVQNELRTYDMTQDNSAVSSDSQPVFMIVQVNHSLDKTKAVELYKETGGNFVERILDPAVFQDVKEVTASYKAIEFAKNREKIRQEIVEKLKAEVGPHGIQVNSVALKNVDFTEALSHAIEQTVEAEQQAKRAEAQVAIATAQANSKVATAKGNAESTIVNAKADAQAQRLKKQTLSPLLVQMAAIDKLNPNVSVIVCTQGQVCIPNSVLATAGK